MAVYGYTFGLQHYVLPKGVRFQALGLYCCGASTYVPCFFLVRVVCAYGYGFEWLAFHVCAYHGMGLGFVYAPFYGWAQGANNLGYGVQWVACFDAHFLGVSVGGFIPLQALAYRLGCGSVVCTEYVVQGFPSTVVR